MPVSEKSGGGNLAAYEGIEALSNYQTRQSLLDYRAGRLGRYDAVVECIRAKSPSPGRLAVVEVGSGSSALLYALSRENLLARGLGIEISRSRHEFAELWKQEDGYDRVENINANFHDVEMAPAEWDWCVVIDNTFSYLFPEDSRYPAQLLRKAHLGLADGGRILIDLINYAKRPPGIADRDWTAFGETDPFSFGLYTQTVVDGVNRSESLFIGRDGSQARKTDLSKVYPLDELTVLLDSCGFEVAEVFSAFTGAPYIENASDRLVVIGRKRGNSTGQAF